MKSEPISPNQCFAKPDNSVVISSLQAATTMFPSTTFSLLMNASKSSDDLYVSNTFASSTAPVSGLIITMCNPL